MKGGFLLAMKTELKCALKWLACSYEVLGVEGPKSLGILQYIFGDCQKYHSQLMV
jgi:hypothetical protein